MWITHFAGRSPAVVQPASPVARPSETAGRSRAAARPGRAVNRAVHAAATAHGVVRRVDDRVDILRRDVSADDGEGDHPASLADSGDICTGPRSARSLESCADLPPQPWRPGRLAAALLFGAGTPIAKLLLADVSPWMLAGLLYLGSGLGLGAYRLIRRRTRPHLERRELLPLAGAVFFGGLVGPVLLMFGLLGMPASGASLLLNAEGVATALLAWFVFKENFDRRIALGMAAIVAGAVVLSWPGQADFAGICRPSRSSAPASRGGSTTTSPARSRCTTRPGSLRSRGSSPAQ